MRGGVAPICESIQLAVFEVRNDCTSDVADWSRKGCLPDSDLNRNGGLDDEGIFEVSRLEPGKEYFLMIDGVFGSECFYTINALSGFSICPLNVDYEKIDCQDDGSFFVTIPIYPSNSGETYEAFETNDVFLDFPSVLFVDDGSTNSIRFGPYPPGSSYNIQINSLTDTTLCELNISGNADCEIPCEDLEVQYDIICDEKRDSLTIVGTIIGGTSPFSIFSQKYNTVIFPNETPQFKLDRITLEPAEQLDLLITDFSGCQDFSTISLENCKVTDLNVKKHEEEIIIDLYPNPTRNRLWVCFGPLKGRIGLQFKNCNFDYG